MRRLTFLLLVLFPTFASAELHEVEMLNRTERGSMVFVPGTYGVKCSPHSAMGMVMLVQVGDTPTTDDNLPYDLPIRARERLVSYIADR